MFYDSVADFAEKARVLKPHIVSEEATKTALIMPFFQQILGWDVFNPVEFTPEYKANFRTNGNDRVDFAILVSGKPVILIEAKHVNEPLEPHVGQLASYYAPTDARFAVLTNGLSYRFFCDVEKENIMDAIPFLDIDLFALDDRSVAELASFRKEQFDYDSIVIRAFELLHENAIYARLSQEIENPSDEFVRLLSVNKNIPAERLKPIARAAILRYITDSAVETAQTSPDELLTENSLSSDIFSSKQLEVMEAVKSTIISTKSKHRYKVNFVLRRKYCEVSYRKYAVCVFPRIGNDLVSTIRFFGTTVESRKLTTESPCIDAASVSVFSPQIIKQLEFIDWLYLNPKAESGGIE
jgi:hypothetical protein